MTKKRVGKVSKIDNSLRKTLYGSRRISRDVAIRQAEYNVGEMRDEFTDGLRREISKIAALVGATDEHLSDDALKSGKELAAVIFNLAGALGYSSAQVVAASLHDLLVVMSERGLRCVEPVIVHGLAAQCAAPGTPGLSEHESRALLDHLNKIIMHFRDQKNPCKKTGCKACPGAVYCI